MKIIITLLIFFLQRCLSDVSIVNFDFSEEDAQKNPWIVLITDESSIIGYGNLIHERAVLTLALMDPKPSVKFPYKVHADCYDGFESYSRQRTTQWHCSQVKEIKEYYVIENNIRYSENFAILILEKPFELNNKVRILELSDNNEKYYTLQCQTFSLRTVLNDKNNKKAQFFVPIPINLYDGDSLYSYNTNIFDLLFVGHSIPPGKESFANYPIGSVISFTGSPVICKHEEDHNYWRLIALTNMEFNRYDTGLSSSSSTSNRVMRIDQNIKKILMDIVEMGVNLERNNHNKKRN